MNSPAAKVRALIAADRAYLEGLVDGTGDRGHYDQTIHTAGKILDLVATGQEKGPDESGPDVTITNGGAGHTGATHIARHQLDESLHQEACRRGLRRCRAMGGGLAGGRNLY